jgi:hypothetical protein
MSPQVYQRRLQVKENLRSPRTNARWTHGKAAAHASPRRCRASHSPARRRVLFAQGDHVRSRAAPCPSRRGARHRARPRVSASLRTPRVILPAALPCLLALRLGVSRSTRIVGAWLALDIVCAAVASGARDAGNVDLERAAWCLPGLALACVAMGVSAARRWLVLPVVLGAIAWGLGTARSSAWWLVAGLGAQAATGALIVLRNLSRARRVDPARAVLLALLVLDLASATIALIVGIHASWAALADLRLTAHGVICLTLALSPSRD